jgi:hypothetical protein
MLLYAARLAGVLRRASASGENAAKARRMLERMSLGGSLETLMHICRMDSGTILACARGEGVEARAAGQVAGLPAHLARPVLSVMPHTPVAPR